MAKTASLVQRDVSPIEVLLSPFARFAEMEAAGSILLLVSTAMALIWANSPWEARYHAIWNTQAFVGFGRFSISESRHLWVNDGLMSIFFFLVGLEIKREILVGELSSFKQAAFPLISALGGTLVPALVYMSINLGKPGERGWGIPMATDIAFALGILVFLGDRVPLSLKVFVTALAIVDDVLAVLVIAIFYSSHIHLFSLVAAGAGVAVSIAANLLGVRRPLIYALVGVCIWFAVLKSGLHATVAGVILAFTIPAQASLDRNRFIVEGRSLLERFAAARPGSDEEHAVISRLEKQCKMLESPLHRIEHSLQPWVSLLVMPLFAFANAGVHLLGKVTLALTHPVTLGVALGLLVGKPIGIFTFGWYSVKAKIAVCPASISWRQILGASCLCGIGFTMSLFIATLAFGEGWMLDVAKIGTLGASVAAGLVGGLLLSVNRSPASEKN